MITKQDLQEAIAECQGTRNPNANTAVKLAAFLTILDHIEEEEKKNEFPQYGQSFAAAHVGGPGKVEYSGTSEFAQAVNGRTQQEVFSVLDELMDTIRALNERLYDGVMRKLR